MQRVTLGGERLGSGNKMKVSLHGYERSTFDLSTVTRTTMSTGTLVPIFLDLALPGDTWDMKIQAYVNTHPTEGPLFGSAKLQIDFFKGDFRLYQAQLHNNELNIGRNMAQVKLPLVDLWAFPTDDEAKKDLDNSQVNPACIWRYLGISGIAYNNTAAPVGRSFNAIPFLLYWDIYKNYYSNKQETNGYVIHAPKPTLIATVTSIVINVTTLPQAPTVTIVTFQNGDAIGINYTGSVPDPSQIFVNFFTPTPRLISMADLVDGTFTDTGTSLSGTFNWARWGNMAANNWDYQAPNNIGMVPPQLQQFALTNIDEMRRHILQHTTATPVRINDLNLPPYNFTAPPNVDFDFNPLIQTQEGLGIKTYQSDINQNWLNTEWISGVTGVNEITAISTAAGNFKLDALYLANKIYQLLNRVVVSDGSYNAWINTVYDHERFVNSEIPTYHGSLIKEIIFQEVISNSAATSDSGTTPLGTLAGKGLLSDKHKGGFIRIKVNEPAHIMGIASITPRIDYSQGNRWFTTQVITMNDLHMPELSQIGFQDTKAETLAWWSTFWRAGTSSFVQASYGKQTGWIHYQTNVNRTFGNFAIAANEMFMTFNRRYEPLNLPGSIPIIISDLTSYIDPEKFNQIFAQTSLDAQNFWVQIGIEATVRRKMSSKVMPNL